MNTNLCDPTCMGPEARWARPLGHPPSHETGRLAASENAHDNALDE
jgi:hypothetical protein